MEVLNKPKLIHLASGETFKLFFIEGNTGMKMPPHHSTQDAIIVIQKGEALLQMPHEDHFLKRGDSFIIPAKKEHSLTIKKDLKAIAVMAVESEIIFI